MEKFFSPAKINLLLNVLRRRPDGYHELETVFERLSFGDTLRFYPHPDKVSLTVRGLRVPSGPSNLVLQAANLLKERYAVSKGVRLVLEKRIPVSAGLGGGSSNAAATLLGLNRLWKLRLSQNTLGQLAAELGSDVPFFVMETSFAMGTGRGEKLRRLRHSGRKFWHVLVKPPFGISTKEAYGCLKPPFLTLPRADVKMLVHSIQIGDARRLSGLLSNSLEVALNKRVTTIQKIKDELSEQGSLGALLSGSGSCVFGLFSDRQKAARAARILGRSHRGWKVFVASTF